MSYDNPDDFSSAMEDVGLFYVSFHALFKYAIIHNDLPFLTTSMLLSHSLFTVSCIVYAAIYKLQRNQPASASAKIGMTTLIIHVNCQIWFEEKKNINF